MELHIVFDGPPGPEAPKFMEVEDETGKSVDAGEWRERKDGSWELVIRHKCVLPDSIEEALNSGDGSYRP